ncbi:MAG TPA: IS30 family transposase [Clostridiales bacterium]|nr:IS30 family transposase [Clostridiales bacterium]
MSGKRLLSSHPRITLDDRIVIQEFLDQGTRLRDLAGQIKKHPSTVVREIKRSRSRRQPPHFNDRTINNCAHKKTCMKRSICKPGCHLRCSACSKCNTVCPDFVRDECPTPLRFPYVCNACPTKNGCRKTKFFYSATVADTISRDLRKSPRLGISLSEQQLLDLDLLLTPLIQKGQPINHIYATQKEKIPCSKRTLYRYIDLGYLAARNIDLRRKVSYKPRKSRKKKAPDPAYRKNRTYADFLVYAGYNPDLQIVEMDTVIGRIGGKTFLTLLFRDLDLLLIFLLQNNTQSAVLEVFDHLENTLGIGLFQACLPVVLTDNGSEFQNPDILEKTSIGSPRCRIFYCDPMASWQKGRIEKAHEYIRYVLPKGSSFDGLSQDDVDLLMNHINCTCRDILGESCPFDLACQSMADVVTSLQLYRVPANQVHLKPDLIKQ